MHTKKNYIHTKIIRLESRGQRNFQRSSVNRKLFHASLEKQQQDCPIYQNLHPWINALKIWNFYYHRKYKIAGRLIVYSKQEESVHKNVVLQHQAETKKKYLFWRKIIIFKTLFWKYISNENFLWKYPFHREIPLLIPRKSNRQSGSINRKNVYSSFDGRCQRLIKWIIFQCLFLIKTRYALLTLFTSVNKATFYLRCLPLPIITN